MKKVLIAGGLCGTTMLAAAEKITERCAQRSVTVDVVIQNVWETTYVRPGYDLIIEMFPFCKDQKCPILSGKPFISHAGEKELLAEITELLCTEEKS